MFSTEILCSQHVTFTTILSKPQFLIAKTQLANYAHNFKNSGEKNQIKTLSTTHRNMRKSKNRENL